MSFSQAVNKAVNDVVLQFLKSASAKFNISEIELVQFWNGESVQVTTPVPTPTPTSIPPSSELSKLAKNELVAHCKSRGLKTTGNKQELIDRLTGGVTTVEAASDKEEKKKVTKAKPVQETKIATHVQSTIQTVQIKKNSFGNFEHVETGLVFDRITQKVMGKQNANGKIDCLNDNDIETCNKFKFKYDLPENLNTNTKSSVSIEGLEDDEDDIETNGDIINEAEDLIEEEEIVEDDGVEEFFEEED
jgi:hypothetical protein